MPLANGELIVQLVKQAQIKNPQINKTGISGDDGSGLQPYGFAAKQLLNAEKGENVSTQKLDAIAQRLSDLLGKSVKAEDLVRAEAEEAEDVEGTGPVTRISKKMIAKSKKNAPAVNAEEGAQVSINISVSPKE